MESLENSKKVILHLCASEYGSDSKPYRDAGYDVRLITKEIGVENYHPPENVYGIIANPPCTEFSLAKGGAKRDFEGGMKLVKACLEIIWACRISGGLKWWVLENPRGFLRQFLGKPPYTYEQWEFGGGGIKPTDLWGYFNAPKKSVKTRPAGLSQRYPNGRWNAKGWSKKSDERSIASPYFTKAFFEANP